MTIIAVCSCGKAIYDAAEMNYHGVDNPVHQWVYVPDILLVMEPVGVQNHSEELSKVQRRRRKD